MLFFVAIIDCTRAYHVVQNITTYHTLLLLLTALELLFSYSFRQGLGNMAQSNTTADILIEEQLHAPLDMVTVD